ncbi:hypothetical protein D3C83_135490 [compost metagenome]
MKRGIHWIEVKETHQREDSDDAKDGGDAPAIQGEGEKRCDHGKKVDGQQEVEIGRKVDGLNGWILRR